MKNWTSEDWKKVTEEFVSSHYVEGVFEFEDKSYHFNFGEQPWFNNPSLMHTFMGYINGLEKAKAQAVPEGYVLLPRVPTEKMLQATDTFNQGMGSVDMNLCYEAMVEASESGAE